MSRSLNNLVTTSKWIPIGPAPVQNNGPGTGGNSGCTKRAAVDLTTGNCLTSGPAAAGDPNVATYLNQMHVSYRDNDGLIQDAWYDGNSGNWYLQQLNGSGQTSGTLAAGDPRIVVYGDQMHVCYRDRADLIQDAWYSQALGQWYLQQLNSNGTSGQTSAPQIEGNPAIASYLNGTSNQMHVCYLTPDGWILGYGVIQDIWYDGNSAQWNQEQLVWTGGITDGPVAAGNPAAVQYNTQLHVCYLDGSGFIQNVYYESLVGQWYIQQLNGSGGLAGGPLADGDPSVVIYNNQLHVCFRDKTGLIQDSWYDPGQSQWNQQQINGSGGLTDSPLAVGDPELVVYNNQMHVCYRDANGWLQDAWYDGNSSQWNSQQLTGTGGLTPGPAFAGDPSLAIYDDQMHVCYRDLNGIIQDAWYNGATGGWTLQQIAGNPEVIYIAAAGGGVWKAVLTSIPPSWTPLTDSTTSLEFDYSHILAVHQVDHQLIFAGVSGAGACVLKSSDAGATLTRLGGSRFDNNFISAIALHPAETNVVFASTFYWGGLSQSTDGGSSWQSVAGGLPANGVADVIFARFNSNILYVAVVANTGTNLSQNGIYRSADGGSTWTQLSGPLPVTTISGSYTTASGTQYANGMIRLESGLANGVLYAIYMTLAARPPFVSVFGPQEHIAYVDAAGTIWDAWYDGSWNLQQITCTYGLLPSAPAASQGPFVCVFGVEQHFAYVDYHGTVWDAYYDQSAGKWNLWQINAAGGLAPSAPAGTGGPFVWVSQQQLHFTYYDSNGTIWDCWFNSPDGGWSRQQINSPPAVPTAGQTTGPATTEPPCVCVFNQQQHVGYIDENGTIWDSYYDIASNQWYRQQINGSGGLTPSGPAAVAPPVIWIYGQQQHFTYYDANGTIWDSWYDGPSNNWSIQQINSPSGVPTTGQVNGPATGSQPSVCVFNQHQHIAFTDADDNKSLWNAYYDAVSKEWNLQKINHGGMTSAMDAVGSPFIWADGQQLHFTYQDGSNSIWDVWYDNSSGTWNVQQIHNSVQRFKSSDGGSTWQNLAYTPGPTEPRSAHFFLAVDPQNDQHILVNDAYSIYESQDSGNTWARADLPPSAGFDWMDVSFDAADNCIATADQGPFLYNPQTAQWQSLIGNLQITTFYDITVSGQYIYGTGQDQYAGMGLNLSATQLVWQPIGNNGESGETGKILRASGSNYTFSYNPLNPDGNLIWRTSATPPSTTWESIWVSSEGGNYGVAYATQKSFVMDPSNQNRLLVGIYQVHETTAATASPVNWSQISDIPSTGQYIIYLAIAPSNGNIVYAATSDGQVWLGAKSSSGWSWNTCNAGLPANNANQITDLRIDAANANHAFAVTTCPGGVPAFPASWPNVWELTTPASGTPGWSNISGQNVSAVNGVNFNAQTIYVDWNYPTPCLYIGTNRGIYHSVDKGLNWNLFSLGFPTADVRDLQAELWNTNTATSLLVAATYGRGAWAILLAPSSVAGTVFASASGFSNPPTGPVLAGATIFLDYNGSGNPSQSIFHAVTDPKGNFQFTNIPPGIYTIMQVPPTDYTQVSQNLTPVQLNGTSLTGIVIVDQSTTDGNYIKPGLLRILSAPGEWRLAAQHLEGK
jgi:photosystem II stability/assembly factor-like uncharacterized protein